MSLLGRLLLVLVRKSSGSIVAFGTRWEELQKAFPQRYAEGSDRGMGAAASAAGASCPGTARPHDEGALRGAIVRLATASSAVTAAAAAPAQARSGHAGGEGKGRPALSRSLERLFDDVMAQSRGREAEAGM